MSARSFKRAHARRIARERKRLEHAKRRALVAGATLGASAIFATAAQAAMYTVANTNPTGSGSLAAEVALANADPSGQKDTIQFQGGLTGTITVASPLTISGPEDLTIEGPGASTLKVSGGGSSQVFAITAPEEATDEIDGLTITDGEASTGGAIGATPLSGDDASAALKLTDDTITDSTSTTTTEDKGGGGIFAQGDVTITGSTISGNTAAEAGGGVAVRKYQFEDEAPSLSISGSTITGNTALDGGGVYGGEANISGSQITGNHATSGSSSDGDGGGIEVGEGLSLTNSTVSGNTSTNEGGGIQADPEKYLTIKGSAISGNTSGSGGGLWLEDDTPKYAPETIQTSTIAANKANDGAGVYVSDIEENAVTITGSTISGNQGQGASSIGGGVEIYGDVYGKFELSNSTISGNTAAVGGGVSLGADPSTDDSLTGGSGTGTPGSIAFRNSTIAANAATKDGGGIYLSAYESGTPSVLKSGTAAIASTIVSGNTSGGAAQDLTRAAGSTSGGFDTAFSLVQAPGTAPLLSEQSDILGKSPELGPLANNGGSMETMLPAGTSPVIDQGHAPESLTTDERGEPRTVDIPGIPRPPGGDGTDIGAVELPASSVPAVFGATLRGTLLTSAVSPLLPGKTSPIECVVRVGTLSSCVVHVMAGGKVLADGDAQSSGSTTLAVSVTPTAAGLAAIAKAPLGITAPVTILGGGDGGTESAAGNVHLLAGPLFTLPLGKRSAKLSKTVQGELKQVARLLAGAGAKSATCTAYTKKGPHKGKKDKSVTTAEAKATCTDLKKAGFKGKTKSVGKGHMIATNQVVITFTF